MRKIRLTDTLGSGSFGTVYRGELQGTQGVRRTVAVKVLAKSHVGREMFLSRIRDEARLLGLLEDDFILKVLELLRVEGRDAVMMEYVEGVDMATLVENGLLCPPRALATVGATLAGALHKAHTAVHPVTGQPLGVVHRDVKPANVMLTARGGVKLLDFGVAKAAFESRESHTGQLVLGTLNYMAPEYLVTGSLSTAVDIYGLGLLMVEAATGQAMGQPKLIEAKFERKRESFLAALPEDYAPLVAPLRRMLDWDPAARPSGAEVEQMLLDISDEMRGTGLRRWCADAVPQAMAARPPVKDGEGLRGQTVIIESGEMLMASDDGADVTSPVLEPTKGVRAPSGIKDQAVRERWSPEPDPTRPAPAPRTTEWRSPQPDETNITVRRKRQNIMKGVLIGTGAGVIVVILMVAIFALLR
ncbi:MAG: serine/threonine protein kinase [Alphaproteobacteria bacterium]|nr:serine/threonine protein kinase [Alphaproteobacteria bacterium]